jgi:hypothetical protein
MLKREHFALFTTHAHRGNKSRQRSGGGAKVSMTTYTAMRWGKPVTAHKKRPNTKSYGRVPKRPPMYTTEHALVTACANGHLGVVKLLLKEGHTDPTTFENSPLKVALGARHSKICERLLSDPRVLESADLVSAFAQAAGQKHAMVGVVKLLLQV